MKDPTLREAAQAAVTAMGKALKAVKSWDDPPGFETWANLANAGVTLRAALERYERALGPRGRAASK